MVELSSSAHAKDTSFPTEVFANGSYSATSLKLFSKQTQITKYNSTISRNYPQTVEILHTNSENMPPVVRTFHPKLFCSQSFLFP